MSLFVFIWFIIYLFIIWLLFGSHTCGFVCKRNKRDVGVQNRHVILASCAALPHLYSYAPFRDKAMFNARNLCRASVSEVLSRLYFAKFIYTIDLH